jgi:hypothetical protein
MNKKFSTQPNNIHSNSNFLFPEHAPGKKKNLEWRNGSNQDYTVSAYFCIRK